jgi:hypothetical protein
MYVLILFSANLRKHNLNQNIAKSKKNLTLDECDFNLLKKDQSYFFSIFFYLNKTFIRIFFKNYILFEIFF